MPYVNILDATCGGIVRVCMCVRARACACILSGHEALWVLNSVWTQVYFSAPPHPPPSPRTSICLRYNLLTSCSFLMCPCGKLTSSSLVSSRCSASPLASVKWKHGCITLRASTTIFSTKTLPCAQSFSAKASTLWSSLPRRSNPWWTPTPTPARAVTNRQQARVWASSAALGNWRWLWKVAVEGGVRHSRCSCHKCPHAPRKLSHPRRSATWLWSEWREEVGARVEASPSPFSEKKTKAAPPPWMEQNFILDVCVCVCVCVRVSVRERERAGVSVSFEIFSSCAAEREGQNAFIIPDQRQPFSIEWWLAPWG